MNIEGAVRRFRNPVSVGFFVIFLVSVFSPLKMLMPLGATVLVSFVFFILLSPYYLYLDSGRKIAAAIHGYTGLFGYVLTSTVIYAILSPYRLPRLKEFYGIGFELDSELAQGLGIFILSLDAIFLISFIYAVPLVVIPAIRGKGYKADKDVLDDTEGSIEERLTTLKTIFSTFQKRIDKERQIIDQISIELGNRVSSQIKTLESAKKSADKAREEMEYYKKISALSKNEQDLFLKILNRNKKNDYWIGLLSGIFSSALVTTVAWYISKRIFEN